MPLKLQIVTCPQTDTMGEPGERRNTRRSAARGESGEQTKQKKKTSGKPKQGAGQKGVDGGTKSRKKDVANTTPNIDENVDANQQVGDELDELRRKVHDLERERNALRGRNAEIVQQRDKLRAEATAKERRKRGQGKERWEERHLSGEHHNTQLVINRVVKDEIFRVMKFCEDGWEIYTEEDDTVCHTIMDNLETIPEGSTKEEYWDYIRKAVFYKWGMLRGQARKKIESALYGKSIVCA